MALLRASVKCSVLGVERKASWQGRVGWGLAERLTSE